VLRNIFGLKKEYITEGWRNLHIEELYTFLYSPNIFRNIISRRVGREVHVAVMWNEKYIQNFSRKRDEPTSEI
jgi:hypothetical protein